MKLTSNKFGTGTLISEDNGKATIDFSGDVKTLIVLFANLTFEDGSKFEASTVAPTIEPSKPTMSEDQFIAELRKRDIAFCRHQAMSGSQYWTVVGVRYRKSDHINPNKCMAIDNPTEVSTYSQFMDMVNKSID